MRWISFALLVTSIKVESLHLSGFDVSQAVALFLIGRIPGGSLISLPHAPLNLKGGILALLKGGITALGLQALA